jgi:hypothetical protein
MARMFGLNRRCVRAASPPFRFGLDGVSRGTPLLRDLGFLVGVVDFRLLRAPPTDI